MPKNITVFTTNQCAYCAMVKKYLDAKKVAYQIRNMEEEPEAQKVAFELSGSLRAPITVVTKADDSREVVVGYNLTQLAPAIA